MITVNDAAEVLRLNKYLKELRAYLAAFDGCKAVQGTMTVTMRVEDGLRWGDKKDITVSSEALASIALGYIRKEYENRIADTIRKLNAIGGEIQK